VAGADWVYPRTIATAQPGQTMMVYARLAQPSQTMTVTTQEAADLLGVSRPTVVKLLGEHKIPYERVGSHRKILLRDLLEYRERRRAEQYAALEATAMSVDDEEGVEAVLDRLRTARRVVAERRRGPSDA